MERTNSTREKTLPAALISILSLLPVLEMTRYFVRSFFYPMTVLFVFSYFYLSLDYARRLIKGSCLSRLFGFCLVLQLLLVIAGYFLIKRWDLNILVLIVIQFVGLVPQAFNYYGAYLGGAVKCTLVLACLLCFSFLKFGIKRGWLLSYFLSASLLYAFSLFIMFGPYYNLPLKHTGEDIRAQGHQEIIEFKMPHPAARRLAIDDRERFLYVAYASSFSTREGGPGGLCKYDLKRKEEVNCYCRGGSGLVLPPGSDRIYLSVYKERIVELDLDTLRETGRSFDIGRGLDKIELLDSRTIAAQSEYPLDHDIYFIEYETGRTWHSSVSKIPGFSINNTLEPYTKTGEVFELQNGFGRNRLIKVSREGEELGSVDLGFSIEVYYAPVSDTVYVPSFFEDIMYVVDPETLEYRTAPMKRIIREIVEVPDGETLILANYHTGEIYIYSIRDEKIEKTLLTGRKPEAIGIGKNTGRLFVASSFGIQIFDLPAILSEIEQ